MSKEETRDTITFNKISAKSFKKEYNLAVSDGKEEFTFQGKEFLTAYAKYVLEYLKMQKIV